MKEKKDFQRRIVFVCLKRGAINLSVSTLYMLKYQQVNFPLKIMQINHCLQININILGRKSRILNLQDIFIISTKRFFYAGL